jgi:hypothetical protein
MVRRCAVLVWVSCLLLTASTAVAATKTWTGSVNNLWSVGGNWADSLPPVDFDSLVFPAGGANRNTENDIIGLTVASIVIAPTSSPAYSVTGKPIELTGGLSTTCCSSEAVVWDIPMLLMGSQTFAAAGKLDLANLLSPNGNTVTIHPSDTTLSGSIIGTGQVIVDGAGFNLTGTSEFFGDLAVLNGGLNVDGTITNGSVYSDASPTGTLGISGSGVLNEAVIVSSTVRPGSFPGAFCCGDPHTTAILSSASISIADGTFAIDLNGTTPGTNYDQLSVTGDVYLTNPTLQVSLPGVIPTAGQTFVIIANDGTDAINGTFNALPEGATFIAAGTSFSITYIGGDGNDVVLTALAPAIAAPVPAAGPTGLLLLGVALALVGVVVMRS